MKNSQGDDSDDDFDKSEGFRRNQENRERNRKEQKKLGIKKYACELCGEEHASKELVQIHLMGIHYKEIEWPRRADGSFRLLRDLPIATHEESQQTQSDSCHTCLRPYETPMTPPILRAFDTQPTVQVLTAMLLKMGEDGKKHGDAEKGRSETRTHSPRAEKRRKTEGDKEEHGCAEETRGKPTEEERRKDDK